MARQTRAQRRARRAEVAGAGEAALPGAPSAPPRLPTARDRAQPEPERGPRAVPGGGARRFVSESWAELKKVEWPAQKQLIQGVVVVLVACIVVGIYLYLNDQVWQRFVQHVLLR